MPSYWHGVVVVSVRYPAVAHPAPTPCLSHKKKIRQNDDFSCVRGLESGILFCMKHATTENIQAIIIATLRGESQEAIGERLGIHRQTVKRIMNLRDYRTMVDAVEHIFMTVPLEEERQRKNAIILRVMSMSHMDKDDVLKTAQQLASEYYSDLHQHLFVDMQDVENFCRDFHIIIPT